MISYFSELRYKEVIDVHTGKVQFFGLFGREDDYILPWKCIVRIGGDIILVETEADQPRRRRKKEKIFDKMAKNY